MVLKTSWPPTRWSVPAARTERKRLLPMPHQRKCSPPLDVREVQRAILFQLLLDDHAKRWTRHELQREFSDIQPCTFNDALRRMERKDVAQLSGELVHAFPCAKHLNTLEVIAI
jgi:hypothetical protein